MHLGRGRDLLELEPENRAATRVCAHAHGAAVHAHPHVHPSRRLLAALGGRRGQLPLRALLVGAIHGLAGSAAVSLLVLATLSSAWRAAAYLTVFGLGTVVGMTALTAAMAYPVTRAVRLRYARGALGICAGVGSIVFGLAYGFHAF